MDSVFPVKFADLSGLNGPPYLPSWDATCAALRERRVMVVEDEALIAMDIGDCLQKAGAVVIGPVTNLADAIELAHTVWLDGAILDVDFQGQSVLDAARLLHHRQVPFVFHTGRAQPREFAAEFSEIPVCLKPIETEALLATLAAQMRGDQ